MFATIGRLADRYRLFLLAGWIVLAVAITLLAPNLADVTSNDQSDFLPSDAPSVKAQQMVEQYFPGLAQGPTAVLVFDAGPGHQISSPDPEYLVKKRPSKTHETA